MNARAFFVFLLDNKLLGLSLAEIDRVLPAVQLLDPPQNTAGLAGLLNYRGRILPVLNLRSILGLPIRRLRASDRIVLVQAWDTKIGFIVDEALGVYESEQIQQFPPSLGPINMRNGIEGFIELGQQTIIIQHLERLLASGLAGLAETPQGASQPSGFPVP